MNAFPLDKLISRVTAMIERKKKAVRNSSSQDFKDADQLDHYYDVLRKLQSLKNNGEKFYIKF
jgi:hypothetical protein